MDGTRGEGEVKWITRKGKVWEDGSTVLVVLRVQYRWSTGSTGRERKPTGKVESRFCF